MTWEHGVNGQAQVIKGMQQIIHAHTLLQDKEAMWGCPDFSEGRLSGAGK
jgi:hypothetical protein